MSGVIARQRAAAEVPPPVLSGRTLEAVIAQLVTALGADAAERERTPGLDQAALGRLRRSGLLGLPALSVSVATLADVVRRLAAIDASLALVLAEHYAAATLAIDAPGIVAALLLGERLTRADTALRAVGPIGASWIVLAPQGLDGESALLDAATASLTPHSLSIGLRGTGIARLDGRDASVVASLHPSEPALLLGDLLVAAVALGIAEGTFAHTASFVAAHTRPWFEAEGAAVSEEPAVLHQIGKLAVDLRAVDALLVRATGLLDAADPAAAGAIAEAAASAGDLALAAASELFAVAGASAADEVHNHSRFWRDARTLTTLLRTQDKFQHAGRVALRDERPVLPAQPERAFEIGGHPPLITSAQEAIAVAQDYAAIVARDAVQRDRDRAFPSEALRLLAATGLLGITVPRDHGGGAEVSLETVVEVLRIFATADSSLGQIPQGQFGVVGSVRRGGTDEQKRLFFAEALRGARFGNASAERAVAHAKVVHTRLTKGPGGTFRLNGRKYYSTGAPEADWVAVLALDEDDIPLNVLVPRGARGFEVLADWDSMGQRGTGSGTTILDDVLIEPVQVLPPWFVPGTPSVWAAVANIKHVGAHLGVAEAAFSDLVALLQRQGEIHDPLVLDRLGRLAAKVHAGQVILRDGARHLERVEALDELTHDAARAASLDITQGKVFIGEAAIEIANELFALAGEDALDEAAGYDRHWRNIRTHSLHDPNRWRYIRAGDFLLNGNLPPANRNN